MREGILFLRMDSITVFLLSKYCHFEFSLHLLLTFIFIRSDVRCLLCWYPPLLCFCCLRSIFHPPAVAAAVRLLLNGNWTLRSVIAQRNTIRNSSSQSACRRKAVEEVPGQVVEMLFDKCAASASLSIRNPEICFCISVFSLLFDCCYLMDSIPISLTNHQPATTFNYVQYITRWRSNARRCE